MGLTEEEILAAIEKYIEDHEDDGLTKKTVRRGVALEMTGDAHALDKDLKPMFNKLLKQVTQPSQRESEGEEEPPPKAKKSKKKSKSKKRKRESSGEPEGEYESPKKKKKARPEKEKEGGRRRVCSEGRRTRRGGSGE